MFGSSSEAFSLLVGWINSLFLVTAVQKLPSAGARWHAASWKGCVGKNAPVHHVLLTPLWWPQKLNRPVSIKIIYCRCSFHSQSAKKVHNVMFADAFTSGSAGSFFDRTNMRRGDKWSVFLTKIPLTVSLFFFPLFSSQGLATHGSCNSLRCCHCPLRPKNRSSANFKGTKAPRS